MSIVGENGYYNKLYNDGFGSGRSPSTKSKFEATLQVLFFMLDASCMYAQPSRVFTRLVQRQLLVGFLDSHYAIFSNSSRSPLLPILSSLLLSHVGYSAETGRYGLNACGLKILFNTFNVSTSSQKLSRLDFKSRSCSELTQLFGPSQLVSEVSVDWVSWRQGGWKLSADNFQKTPLAEYWQDRLIPCCSEFNPLVYGCWSS